MTVISPSLLASDFMNLSSELNKLNSIKDIWLHLDIMDGHFVPNLTFGHEIIKKISAQSTNQIDVHLMVDNPDFYIETLKNYQIHNITWHFENKVNHEELIKKAKRNFQSIGISIKPDTQISEIPTTILSEVDLILVMSVEPGFGGQQFMESSVEKVRLLENIKMTHKLNFITQVDGGINEQNAHKLIEAGASNLVAGSYIFKGDIATQVKKLKNL